MSDESFAHHSLKPGFLTQLGSHASLYMVILGPFSSVLVFSGLPFFTFQTSIKGTSACVWRAFTIQEKTTTNSKCPRAVFGNVTRGWKFFLMYGRVGAWKLVVKNNYNWVLRAWSRISVVKTKKVLCLTVSIQCRQRRRLQMCVKKGMKMALDEATKSERK